MTHPPKVRALLAYEAGRLGARGRDRVERHLASCEVCDEALAAMRAYDELVKEVRAEPLPRIDWSAMELTLRREAREQARAATRAAPSSTVGLVALAAAALLAVVLAWPSEERVVEVELPQPSSGAAPEADRTPEAAPAPAPVTARVTAVAGCPAVDGRPGCVELGAEVGTGDRLTTGAGALAHLRVAEGTGFVAHAGTDLAVTRLEPGTVELSLSAGRVSSLVSPRADGERYEVRADEWTVRVRGTRFEVARDARGVGVTVDEGVVEVVRGDEVVTLRSPARWTSAPGVGASEQGAVALPRVAVGLEWPALTLPDLAHVDVWEIDGAAVEAVGRLSMRVPTGPLAILGRGPRGLYRATLDIGDEGAELEEQRLVLASEAAAAPRGELTSEEIRPVVQAGMRDLRRCYDRALRRRPDLRGRYSARVLVDRAGGVRQVRLSAPDAPAEFASCITDEARSWRFPAPRGGVVWLDVPLNFAPRRR